MTTKLENLTDYWMLTAAKNIAAQIINFVIINNF
jgi:hypothetical protein